MKRLAIWAVAVTALALVAGAPQAFAQGTFKIAYEFVADGTKLRAGEYWIAQKDDGHLTLRQEATGKEFQIPFTKRLPQPSPPLEEPQLVFDVVGNFAPSYTEYVTDYLLAEVWLQGADGFLDHHGVEHDPGLVVAGEASAAITIRTREPNRRRRRSTGLATARNVRRNTPTRSAMRSASSRLCVEMITAWPRAFRSRTRSRTTRAL
jgi:hypothetical protein